MVAGGGGRRLVGGQGPEAGVGQGRRPAPAPTRPPCVSTELGTQLSNTMAAAAAARHSVSRESRSQLSCSAAAQLGRM